MSFFDRIFGKKDKDINISVKAGNISNSSIANVDYAPIDKSNKGYIDLQKRNESITISLAKRGVQDIVSEVKLVLDSSGSMRDDYYNGNVQKVIERIAPLAFRFDDDGTMQVKLFSDYTTDVTDLTMSNLDGYTDRFLTRKVGGCTEYANPIRELTEQAKNGDFKFPVYVIFITDGENSDRSETEKALIEASKYEIYFQFVGIGNSSFRFLENLDNLGGRQFDNAGFVAIADMNKLSDEQLYDKLLEEFINLYKKDTFKTGVINLKK